MKINHIAIDGVGASFLISIVEHLSSVGISARNPLTKRITVFKKNGNAISLTSLSEINSALEICSGIQLWLDHSSDVYISWERINSGIDIFLDGLDENDVARVTSLCSDFSCVYAVEKNTFITIRLDNQSC